jgi:hypothetical protein
MKLRRARGGCNPNTRTRATQTRENLHQLQHQHSLTPSHSTLAHSHNTQSATVPPQYKPIGDNRRNGFDATIRVHQLCQITRNRGLLPQFLKLHREARTCVDMGRDVLWGGGGGGGGRRVSEQRDGKEQCGSDARQSSNTNKINQHHGNYEPRRSRALALVEGRIPSV